MSDKIKAVKDAFADYVAADDWGATEEAGEKLREAINILPDDGLLLSAIQACELRTILDPRVGVGVAEIAERLKEQLYGAPPDGPAVEGPSDTEMLDWLVERSDRIDLNAITGRYGCLIFKERLIKCTGDTPREAIKAAMEMEKSK